MVGCGWKMMSPMPHCSFSKPIIETRSDLKSVHLGQRWAMFDLIKPFRGWIQVFSPNHPPKKVAAGYQWFLAYPNMKSITHPDGCGYPCHHGILW